MAVLGWKSQLAAAGLALALAAPAAADRAPVSAASNHERAAATGDTGARRATSDEALAAQIKERLNKNRMVRQADIIVDVHAGVATLAGSVPSEFARSEAVEIAGATPGVVRVDDKLRLLSSSPEAAVPP